METPEETPVTPEIPNSPEKPKINSQDYRLISKANDDFESGNYDACLEILEQLELLRGSDSKLLHNRAVAKFYKTQCRNHDELLKSLEELDDDKTLNRCDLAVLPQMTSSPPPDPGPSAMIPIYNKAVIFYHRHMFETALLTLKPLVQKLDNCDECSIALIGVLMLRLLLATNRLRKAYDFLEILLQKLGTSTLTLTAEDSNPQEVLPGIDENLARCLKLLCMLSMVVNRKVVLVPEDGTTEFSALKAHQYYIMKDFQMAAKQLKKINVDSYRGGLYNHELNTLIANNMGIIHLRVRHYAIAAKFFQNAIIFDKHIAANLRQAELHQMSSVRSCEILYNLGIAMLHLRRPKEAFQSFLVPLKTYHNNPRLWLRIAEACIMEHELRRVAEEKYGPSSSQKRVLFSNRIPYTESSQSAAVPEPTMPFAALSLRNALFLTRAYSHQVNVTTSSEEGNEEETCKSIPTDNNFCNPSGPVTKESLDIMLSAIYAAYSYVSLRLGDYVTALEMAQELLKTDKISDAHKQVIRLLAHMYAGEALTMMDKLAEARPHFEPTFVSTLNTFDFETKDWHLKSLDAAQNVVRYNLAVALNLKGDFEVAKSLLNTCTHPIVASKVFALKVHIEKTQAAAASLIAPRI
ncbi:CCR4-NOT transcription complex subunit 10 isoform X1 [Glossina fuscipes]|uniref:CCR4-NOT transcription complex subunit 10 n=1 Tax=Glossina fuscipes TaxID=7396 RepID=A0A8U0WKD6_9MUSC|nr:CCR4-NOT transcription complex subunit 10 isoform X1 [Glossina fuscipes]KAI9584433.1 hypothetical protein GQX74_006328 [Glossina fuscipes]